MDVTYDPASSTLYLDLVPGAARVGHLLPAHRSVLVDLDRRHNAVGLGFVLAAGSRLSPGACTALLRYCPDIVGDDLRPDWDRVRAQLMVLAGAEVAPARDQATGRCRS